MRSKTQLSDILSGDSQLKRIWVAYVAGIATTVETSFWDDYYDTMVSKVARNRVWWGTKKIPCSIINFR